jgi:hypothetical protein
MGLLNFFRSGRNSERPKTNSQAAKVESNAEKLYKFEQEGNYEEYIGVFKKFGIYDQINIVGGLDNQTWLRNMATDDFDDYVACVAAMRIDDADALTEIITSHSWQGGGLGEVAILRLIDFDLDEKIRKFLDGIKDEKYSPTIKRIAKALLQNQQLVRDMKAQAYYPRCAAEPQKWVVNLEQKILMASPGA